MKTAGRILAAVLLVLSGLLGGAVSAKLAHTYTLGEQAQKAQEGAVLIAELAKKDPELRAQYKDKLERLAGLRTAGYGCALMTALTLAVLVLSFMKKWTPLLVVAALGAVGAVVLVQLYPRSVIGTDDVLIKSIAMLFGLTAVSGVALSWLGRPALAAA